MIPNRDEEREKIMKMVETKMQERPNSCKISINAKGLWSAEIKVYADTIDEAIEQALNKSSEMDVIIKEKNEC